jgi:hypothetical protein
MPSKPTLHAESRRLLGRFLCFSCPPLGAFLLVWLTSVVLGLKHLASTLSLVSLALFPHMAIAAADESQVSPALRWFIAVAVSMLLAGLTTRLSRRMTLPVSWLVYGGVAISAAITIYVLLAIFGTPGLYLALQSKNLFFNQAR